LRKNINLSEEFKAKSRGTTAVVAELRRCAKGGSGLGWGLGLNISALRKRWLTGLAAFGSVILSVTGNTLGAEATIGGISGWRRKELEA